MPKKPLIYLAADHAGFALKEKIKAKLSAKRETLDLSPKLDKDDDYPLHAKKVALALQSDKNALGILICGSGHGMDIAANRFKGIRAVVARTAKDAKLAREHNHANIVVLGGWGTKPALAQSIIDTFLKTKPSPAARHKRRVKELDELL
ncbi:MAG: RpiB/LacA/LacB family sugar-phosphate isomerase [Patescibacteria group bacterium]